jgi:hypothetical protein
MITEKNKIAYESLDYKIVQTSFSWEINYRKLKSGLIQYKWAFNLEI